MRKLSFNSYIKFFEIFPVDKKPLSALGITSTRIEKIQTINSSHHDKFNKTDNFPKLTKQTNEPVILSNGNFGNKNQIGINLSYFEQIQKLKKEKEKLIKQNKNETKKKPSTADNFNKRIKAKREIKSSMASLINPLVNNNGIQNEENGGFENNILNSNPSGLILTNRNKIISNKLSTPKKSSNKGKQKSSHTQLSNEKIKTDSAKSKKHVSKNTIGIEENQKEVQNIIVIEGETKNKINLNENKANFIKEEETQNIKRDKTLMLKRKARKIKKKLGNETNLTSSINYSEFNLNTNNEKKEGSLDIRKKYIVSMPSIPNSKRSISSLTSPRIVKDNKTSSYNNDNKIKTIISNKVDEVNIEELNNSNLKENAGIIDHKHYENNNNKININNEIKPLQEKHNIPKENGSIIKNELSIQNFNNDNDNLIESKIVDKKLLEKCFNIAFTLNDINFEDYLNTKNKTLNKSSFEIVSYSTNDNKMNKEDDNNKNDIQNNSSNINKNNSSNNTNQFTFRNSEEGTKNNHNNKSKTTSHSLRKINLKNKSKLIKKIEDVDFPDYKDLDLTNLSLKNNDLIERVKSESYIYNQFKLKKNISLKKEGVSFHSRNDKSLQENDISKNSSYSQASSNSIIEKYSKGNTNFTNYSSFSNFNSKQKNSLSNLNVKTKEVKKQKIKKLKKSQNFNNNESKKEIESFYENIEKLTKVELERNNEMKYSNKKDDFNDENAGLIQSNDDLYNLIQYSKNVKSNHLLINSNQNIITTNQKNENKKMRNTQICFRDNKKDKEAKNENMFLKSNNPSKTSYLKKVNNNPFDQIILGPIIPDLPDYSKAFPTFLHIFNGYFLQSNHRPFDYIWTMKEIVKSFELLVKYENAHLVSEVDELSNTIVNAEADIIKNRLKKLSDKLLLDQNELSEEKFYMYKKIIELQKKEYSKQSYFDINESFILDNEKRIVNSSSNKMFFRVVLSRPEVYDIVSYCLGVKPEWRELPHGMMLGNSWNVLWTYSQPKVDLTKIFCFQKVNHLINNRCISRKDYLKKSIERVKNLNKRCMIEFDILPETYILGKEYMEFIESYSQNGGRMNKENIWIVKPNGKSRGRGIFLTNELSDVQPTDGYLVQKYITKPLLLQKQYKFDLRIYVLVTSVNPLEAFIYKDGFARISNHIFDLKNLNRNIHLTNAAIQDKKSKKSDDLEKQYGGSKISLEVLKLKLEKDNIDFEIIWKQIQIIVIKSLIATQFEMSYSPSSFELFGYDIMIDSNLKCWLIEVNMSPSLERSNVLDDQVKLQLVDDILKVVDVPAINRGSLIEVLNRRIQMESRNNVSQSNTNFIYSPAKQLNVDLNSIFEGKIPRIFGQDSKNMGRFQRLCPSIESDNLIKITNKSEKDKFNIRNRALVS